MDIRAISVETQFLAEEVRSSLFSLLLHQGYNHLGPMARDDIFVLLEEGGTCPKMTGQEVLLRKGARACQYFMVSGHPLAQHCMLQWPRDFLAPISLDSLPGCLNPTVCRWGLEAVMEDATKYRHGCSHFA